MSYGGDYDIPFDAPKKKKNFQPKLQFYWKTREGNKIHMGDMSDLHLSHSLSICINKGDRQKAIEIMKVLGHRYVNEAIDRR